MKWKGTFALFLTCVFVFILQNIFPWITNAFSLYPPAVKERPYLLVTALFLHENLQHLSNNMFALLIFGVALETVTDTKYLLATFFISGIFGNIAACFFYPNSFSLGASGAIMGIIGTLTVIRPLMMVWFGGPMPMIMLAGIWIVVNIAGLFDKYSNIGYAAHVFGFLTGILIGFALKNRFKDKEKSKKKEDEFEISEDEFEEWEDEWMRLYGD